MPNKTDATAVFVSVPLRKYSISVKMIVGIIVLTLGVMYTSYSSYSYVNRIKSGHNYVVDLERSVLNISPAITYGIWYYNQTIITETIDTLFNDPFVLSATVFDSNGQFNFSFSRKPGTSIPIKAPLAHDRHQQFSSALKVTDRNSQITRHSREQISIMRPLLKNKTTIGILQVTYSTAELEERKLELKRYSLIFSLTLCIFLILELYFFIKYLVISPITKTAKTIEAIESQSDEVRPPIHTGDEIARLIKSFNRMLKRADRHNKEQLQIKAETASIVALTKTTHLFAHDIRKPFSMVQGLLSILRTKAINSETKDILDKFIPEIQRALSSVNDTIEDILLVCPSHDSKTAPTDVSQLLQSCLLETFSQDLKFEITFSYNLQHLGMLQVNSHKITRVINNILGNAYEAMTDHETISIASKNTKGGELNMIELRIRNSGTYIAQDDLSKIFDLFYSKNKAKGTGIGLASAKTMILDHHGTISCHSSKEYGVEFVIALPAAIHLQALKKITLPKSSRQIISDKI